ncbi:hypothetical protein [Kitasatospora sp. NPDC005856]|uniref:hypothetical protein n=1 Tax=Kitasatospora sp. NPDC005856 TaxID=3154566 RepID=UPI0034086092
MTSGLLDVRAQTADEAALWARRAVRLLRGASKRFRRIHGDVADQVMELGRLYDRWQRTTAMATRALAAFYASGASLDPAVEELRRAETDEVIAADENSVSELRALRYGLLELQRRAGDRWLRVGRGKLVYLYPFAVRGVEPEKLVEAVGQNEASRWELVGTRPVRTHGSLDLDDVWKSHDGLGRRYDGALVVMPDAVVRAPDGRERAEAGMRPRASAVAPWPRCGRCPSPGRSVLHAQIVVQRDLTHALRDDRPKQRGGCSGDRSQRRHEGAVDSRQAAGAEVGTSDRADQHLLGVGRGELEVRVARDHRDDGDGQRARIGPPHDLGAHVGRGTVTQKNEPSEFSQLAYLLLGERGDGPEPEQVVANPVDIRVLHEELPGLVDGLLGIPEISHRLALAWESFGAVPHCGLP